MDSQLFAFVYVNKDGSVRELTWDEREYLETPFHGADSGRPYIKTTYEQLDGLGCISGFCYRTSVPGQIDIAR